MIKFIIFIIIIIIIIFMVVIATVVARILIIYDNEKNDENAVFLLRILLRCQPLDYNTHPNGEGCRPFCFMSVLFIKVKMLSKQTPVTNLYIYRR